MTTLWMTLRDDRGADDTTSCDYLLRRMTAERMTQQVVMTTLWMTLRDDRGADDTTSCDDLLRRMTAERRECKKKEYE
jgi:hypothetical protein